ncbi:hypothetical protein CWE21_10875 [Pseudidiomarina aquimaris]|uniref:Uncharacterized protein n=1 Tax=Pseudidiomarina aquimaris TaxID=641841 RepID=A0A432XD95_9GAMM|nr:hypothetical protein [Pseudidiomarina aquimaris]RUO46650.1 hypothetical protein CWE21_10875 [Pseudidiomarina aquimaris]
MTNMFKRSLIAMAIAGVSTGAMAADVSLTETTYATDQFMSTMDEILSKNVIITLNDEYKEGDYIYLRLENGAYIDGHPDQLTIGFGEQFDEGNFAGNGAIAADPGSYNDDADSEDVNKGMTVDFVAQTTDDDNNTVLIYRVTNIFGDEVTASNDTTYGIELDFGRFNFDAETVVALNGVMFDTFSRLDNQPWPTNTNPWPFDTADVEETQLFKMGDQYALNVETPYDGEIDVWDYRRQFRTDGGSHGDLYRVDEGEFWVYTTTNPDGGSWDFVVNEDVSADWQVRYTLSGANMFGWIASSPLAGEAFFPGPNTANCVYVSHTANEFVFDCDETDIPVNLAFDLLGGPDSAQNPKQDGDFMLSATVNWENTEAQYSDSGMSPGVDFPEDGVLLADPTTGSTDLGPDAAGGWGVNGSITHIPYMPYSAQSEADELVPMSQIIYVTNIYRDPGFDDASDGGSYPDPVSEGETPVNNNVNRIIWVDAVREDGTNFRCTNDDLDGVLANYGITKLAGVIRSCLFEKGALDSSTKFSLTVNVADYPTNVSVYSAYNVNGSDRGWVQNDSVRVDFDLYDYNEIID